MRRGLRAASSTTKRVILIAGPLGRLAEAIAYRLNAEGFTVAFSDPTAGEIQIRPRADRSADVRTAGYGTEAGAGADRQIARLLHLAGRIDGLIQLIAPNTWSVTEQPGPDPVGSSFQAALGLIRAAHDAWMRDNGGCITNVLGAQRYESDEWKASVIDPSVSDALVLTLTLELAAELSGLVDVNAVVVGHLDATLEVLLAASIKRSIAVKPPPSEIETIANAVVDLHTSTHGSRNGEVLVLEFS